MIKIKDKFGTEHNFETSEDFKDWFLSSMSDEEIKNGGYSEMSAYKLLNDEKYFNTTDAFKFLD